MLTAKLLAEGDEARAERAIARRFERGHGGDGFEHRRVLRPGS
jgi:hypothetical protein